jgi:hypothetical protein
MALPVVVVAGFIVLAWRFGYFGADPAREAATTGSLASGLPTFVATPNGCDERRVRQPVGGGVVEGLTDCVRAAAACANAAASA